MDLVIDANILFAVCIAEGKTEELLFSEDLHLFAPEFLFEEFEKYKEMILKKTKRPQNEFSRFVEILKNKIHIIPNEETNKFIESAKKISLDPKDVAYFALALKLSCAIWTNDKQFSEQKAVKIYSTGELIKKFNL